MKKFLLLLTVIFAVGLLMVACGGDESEAPQSSTLAPHSHSYGIWNEVQAPSCTENGQREKACSCGEKITESINALGHSYEYGICKNCKTADKATEGLEYMESEDGEGYIVVGLGTYSSDGNFDLIIPDEYNGKPVIAIGENAFYNENKVRSVVVGKNVRTIDACAFYYISYLRSVVFLGEIEAIGDQAFENCYELSKINLPSSLESIGSCAFKSCKLKEITVSEENQVYSSIDGSLYSKDKKVLILYAIGKNDTEFTVPSGVENRAVCPVIFRKSIFKWYAILLSVPLNTVWMPGSMMRAAGPAVLSTGHLWHSIPNSADVSSMPKANLNSAKPVRICSIRKLPGFLLKMCMKNTVNIWESISAKVFPEFLRMNHLSGRSGFPIT